MKLTEKEAKQAYLSGSEIFFCEPNFDRVGFRRHADGSDNAEAGRWFDYLVKRFKHHIVADPSIITFEVD